MISKRELCRRRQHDHPAACKNQYFTQDKKIVRKVAEMFMAFKIESELDKDTIFELYVNSIFFGNGYYCVADAQTAILVKFRRR